MHRPRTLAALGIVALLASVAAPTLAQPVLRPTGEPPPGFEAFFELQRTVVDVYYAGRFLTSVPASYDIDSLEFEDPAALVAQLPDLLDPARISAALSGPLAINAAAICARGVREDCGRLTPEIAGVIFDASRFRATLFVAPDQLDTRGPDISRYLPPSDSEFAFLQNLSAAVSGADDSDRDNYNVISVTSLSLGETQLQLENSYGSENDLTVDQALVRREFEGRAAQAGLYRSRSQSLGFVRERDLIGLRLESSLATRADRAFAGGTSVQVFLPTRARVEILQDGRLLDSRAYDAGNQVLDTSNLPEGAYDIDIRIREADGGARTERRFFVKTTRLPPADQPLWTLEAGRIVDRNTDDTLPDDTGDWFARAGTARRIADGIGVDVGVAGGLGDALAELGLFRTGRLGEAQVSAFGSAEGAYGVATVGRLQFGVIRLSVDYRRIIGAERGEPPGERLIGTGLEQAGVYLSSPFRGGVLALNARHDNRDGSGSRNAQTLSFDRQLLRSRSGSLRFGLDVSRENDDWVGQLSLQWDYRDGRFSGVLEPGVRYDRFRDGRDDFGSQTDARLAWERELQRGDRLRLALAGTSGAREERIGTEGIYEGRLGAMRASIDRDFDDRDRTSWTGTFNTSVLSDGRTLSIGGRDRARAAALVEIDGEVPDARFEVLVDGYPSGIAPAGSVTPIHLRPWKSYSVRLRPVGSALVAFENREERITLYPGNVVRLNWRVDEIVVVLGRLLDGDGNPVEFARLEGAYGFAMTEAGGLFQAEALRPDSDAALELIAVRRDGSRCTVRIEDPATQPAPGSRAGILRVGNQTCAP